MLLSLDHHSLLFIRVSDPHLPGTYCYSRHRYHSKVKGSKESGRARSSAAQRSVSNSLAGSFEDTCGLCCEGSGRNKFRAGMGPLPYNTLNFKKMQDDQNSLGTAECHFTRNSTLGIDNHIYFNDNIGESR